MRHARAREVLKSSRIMGVSKLTKRDKAKIREGRRVRRLI
jgi:hypothetical protein